MRKLVVSVIVTVFNKESRIKDCLESIERQSYTNIQLIVVDDGSTDNSNDICKKFMQQSDMNCQLIQKSNGGVSSARNVGIRYVLGDYIMFVDGDDSLSSDYVKQMIAASGADLIQSGYSVIENSNVLKRSLTSSTLNLNRSFEPIFTKNLFPFFSVPWAKLFRASIVLKKGITFKEQSYGEDTIFVFEYLKYTSNVTMISSTGYNNVIIPGTLSRGKVQGMWEQVCNVVEAGDDSFDYRYNKEWTFVFLRMIKLFLINESFSYQDFKVAVDQVVKYNDFENLKIPVIDGLIDKVLFLTLKWRWYGILFLLVRLKK